MIGEDVLLTILMFVTAIIMFVIVYIAPVAGVVIGSILLKKYPNRKTLGLMILLVSIAVCVCVATWKTFDIINFGL